MLNTSSMNNLDQQTTKPEIQCAFCFPSEHGKHGEVRREWSIEWTMFIPACRSHAQEIKESNDEHLAKMPKPEQSNQYEKQEWEKNMAFGQLPWEKRKAMTRPFLTSASHLARAMGPLVQAGDHNAPALACAFVNAELLLDGWCKCPKHSSANDCYYCYHTGSHGWMCSSCCRVTQVG